MRLTASPELILYSFYKSIAMKHYSFFAAALLLFSACISGCKSDSKTPAFSNNDSIHPDSVLFSFAFMGCNRIDWTDTANANTNASTANVPELQRSFNEIAQMTPKPDLFFFLGDLVLGLDQDTKKLSSQLKAWKAQQHDPAFSALAKSGIKVIAIPGNHEMLFMDTPGYELPWKEALPTWMSVMTSYMPDGKINRVSGPDSINQLQTYSFDYKNTHFIMVNTDTYNPALKIGIAPASWINSDIATARKSKATEHIFLLGHKPSYVDAPITDPAEFLDTNVTNQIWPVMEQYKVEGMLSAHSHQYYRTQPHPAKSYQIIAGNGGSVYEKHLPKEDQFYGYSVIYILKNGKVLLRSMGRSVPKKDYLESLTAAVKTTTRDAIDMTWGTTAQTWTVGK
jgi:hypothetical protein